MPTALQVFRAWSPHLLSLWFPGTALVFLLTGPHVWWGALLFVVPIAVAHHLDTRGFREVRQPNEKLPAWPFDGLVYLLGILHLVNVVLFVRLLSGGSVVSFDFWIGVLVVGASSGYSIITAHELIHRRGAFAQHFGRLLLCGVLYEHFYTEHLRGHHVRVGFSDDPATARYGETFRHFYLRTVPAQFKNAWRLEKRRLGDESMSNFDPRMLSHRCLHGLVVGWGFGLGVLLLGGLVPFLAFVLQSVFASRALEVVNYFEHWGLVRQGHRVHPRHSWDTHSWFTYYALIGLSRHADHHAHPARPYQALRVFEEPPLLPFGYIGMIPLCVLRNARFQKWASLELRRKGYGPFAQSEGEAA